MKGKNEYKSPSKENGSVRFSKKQARFAKPTQPKIASVKKRAAKTSRKDPDPVKSAKKHL